MREGPALDNAGLFCYYCYMANIKFTIMHEAWYAHTIPSGDTPEIVITYCVPGETTYEFTVTEPDLGPGPRVTQVHVFSESYDIFNLWPEFFARLVAEEPSCLSDVVEILLELDAVDETPRVNPHKGKPIEVDEMGAIRLLQARGFVVHNDEGGRVEVPRTFAG